MTSNPLSWKDKLYQNLLQTINDSYINIPEMFSYFQKEIIDINF